MVNGLSKKKMELRKYSWSFLGDMGNNPVARWIGLMMDSMLGPQLETGLSNMKEYLENLSEEEVVEELPKNSVILELPLQNKA